MGVCMYAAGRSLRVSCCYLSCSGTSLVSKCAVVVDMVVGIVCRSNSVTVVGVVDVVVNVLVATVLLYVLFYAIYTITTIL